MTIWNVTAKIRGICKVSPSNPFIVQMRKLSPGNAKGLVHPGRKPKSRDVESRAPLRNKNAEMVPGALSADKKQCSNLGVQRGHEKWV